MLWKVLTLCLHMRKQQEAFLYPQRVALRSSGGAASATMLRNVFFSQTRHHHCQMCHRGQHTQYIGAATYILGLPFWRVSAAWWCRCAFTYSVQQRLGAPLLLLGGRSGDGPLRVFLQVLGVVCGRRLLHVLWLLLGHYMRNQHNPPKRSEDRFKSRKETSLKAVHWMRRHPNIVLCSLSRAFLICHYMTY